MRSLDIQIFKRPSDTLRYKRSVAAALLFASFLCVRLPVAPQTADAIWSGQVQCMLSMQSSGYAHQEIQTWQLTGEPPKIQGSIAVYPATWSVSSTGAGQRSVNGQFTASQWKSSATPMSAPLGMFLRVNGALVIKSFHALVSAPKAITITRQVSLLGATPSVSTVQDAADEWIMPAIEVADANSDVAGSGTIMVGSTAIPERAGGTAQPADCTWQFTRGRAPQTQHAGIATAAGTLQPSLRTVGVNGTAGGATSGPIPGTGTQLQSSSASGAASTIDTQTSTGASGADLKFSSTGSAAGGGVPSYSPTSAASGEAAVSKTGSGAESSGGSASGATSSSSSTAGTGSGASSTTMSPLPQQPLQLTIVPVISGVVPNSVMIGQFNLPVVITGNFTHFVDGLTSVDFGAPNLIRVNSVKVSSPTTLTANITAVQIGSTPFAGGKFNITVDTPPPANSSPQGVSLPAHEIVSLAGAFNVQPQPLPLHNVTATFSPNSGQQGQTMTVAITGINTHFTQGVTQIQQSALSSSRIGAGSVTVTSPTTAAATFTILPTAITGTSQYALVLTTNTAQSLETALGDFTITPAPDGFSHSQNPTSGVDIYTENTQTFDGQLASLGGEDWFWLECDTGACTIAVQNVSPPTHIVVDVLNAQYLNVASTDQQVNSLAQPPNSPIKIPGESAYYYLRVQATTWDLSHPKYSLVITGTQQ